MAQRDWNTADFYGKYHLSKFHNKLTPLPGSQVAIEQKYAEEKDKYHENLEARVKERALDTETKLQIKLKSTEFKTKVYFDTIIGAPMADTEKVLNEKEALMNSTSKALDSMKSITKFITNIELNRAHYVSYAITSGFRSINYAVPVSGNTALHIASRKGNCETVAELLKFKADPDIKNNLGNHPIHESWLFWRTNANRTKEERIEQEQKTCKILLSILSYGGFVDSQDQKGQSALHVACRLGPVQAVKIILSFKADYLLRTKAGKSCQDIALEFGNEETYKLLNSWQLIRKHIVHLDFHTVWHKFLADYEAVINSHKTAEAILAELEMDVNVKQLERDTQAGIPIEDTLLKAAYHEARNDTITVPRPWEPGWAGYVKHQQAAGVVDLKSKLDSLTRRVKGNKAKHKMPVKGPYGAPSTLPDRPTPEARPRLLHPLSETMTSVMEDNNSLASSTQKQSVVSTVSNVTGDDEDGVDGEEEEEEKVDKYAVRRYKTPKASTTTQTQLDKRRQKLAHAMLLDAKFLKFTDRLATSSALLIPIRAPQAPSDGTEEEGNIIRHIVSQGPDYDKFRKYKKVDRFAEMLGIRYDIPISSIGAYSKACDYTIPNDRDLLYDRIVSRDIAPGAVNSSVKAINRPMTGDKNIATAPGGEIVMEIDQREKIDLVHDKRPRYVNADLLPSSRVISIVERMTNEKRERDAAALLKKQGLSSAESLAAARAEFEAAIAKNAQEIAQNNAQQQSSAVSGGELDVNTYSTHKKKANDERNLTMKNMFLRKEEVKYGAGRITSTHNTKGRIEEPWSTVGGRYTTLPGDRTV